MRRSVKFNCIDDNHFACVRPVATSIRDVRSCELAATFSLAATASTVFGSPCSHPLNDGMITAGLSSSASSTPLGAPPSAHDVIRLTSRAVRLTSFEKWP